MNFGHDLATLKYAELAIILFSMDDFKIIHRK